MQLTIKNDDLGAIIGRLLQEKTGTLVLEGKSAQVHGEDLVGTYALDMIFSGESVGKDLDFSYASLKDLPVAAAACYRRYKAGEHPEFAVDATVKSLAAYFFALAMNEHGLPWEVRQMPVLMNAAKPPKDPLWGVFRIQTGNAKKVDFLLPVQAGCRVREQAGKQLLTFDLSQLIREYKTAVGVDLRIFGLQNIAFDL